MEIGKHVVDNLSFNRTPDNISINFNLEKDYAPQNGNTDTTPSNAAEISTRVVETTTEQIHATSLPADGFSFPLMTKDLNLPPPEFQEEPASTSVMEPAVTPIEELHELACTPAVEPAFTPIEEPARSPTEVLQEPSFNPVIEEPAQEPSASTIIDEPAQEPSSSTINEESAQEPSPNPVIEEPSQEPSSNPVIEEPAPSKPLTPEDIETVETSFEEPQPFDDMVVLKDGMVTVAAQLAEDAAPVVEGVEGDVALSELNCPATVLEDQQASVEEVKGVPAEEPVHDVPWQGDETPSEVLLQGVTHTDEPSGLAGQSNILVAADSSLPSDSVLASETMVQEAVPVENIIANEGNKEGKEESGLLAENQPGKSSGDVEAPNSAQLAVKPSEGEEAKEAPSGQVDEVKGKGFEQEAEALKGRNVLKKFGMHDFVGEIISYDPETKWFKIVYEDGDEEDLEKVEVEPILLAPGTALESVHRKRARSRVDGEKESDRTPKKAKKAADRTPGKFPSSKNQKTTPGSKRKRQGTSKGSKSSGIVAKSSASKSKAVRTAKQSKNARGTKKQPTGSAKKSPGKKTKRKAKSTEGSDVRASAKKSPSKKAKKGTNSADCINLQYEKTPEEARKRRQQKGKKRAATPKKGSAAKKMKNAQKLSQKAKPPKVQKAETEESQKELEKSSKGGRKGAKHEEGQVEDISQKQMAGTKRKAEVKQNVAPESKRFKRGAEKSPESHLNLGGGRATRSKGGAVEVKQEEVEGSVYPDQEGNELGGPALVGRIIRKKFGGVFYNGEVVSFDKKAKYYKVRYEDGDSEDLEWSELEPILTSEVKSDVSAKKTANKKSTLARPASCKMNSGTSEGKNKKHTRSGVATRSKRGANKVSN